MDVDLMLDDDAILVDVRDLEIKGTTRLVANDGTDPVPVTFEALFDVAQFVMSFDSQVD